MKIRSIFLGLIMMTLSSCAEPSQTSINVVQTVQTISFLSAEFEHNNAFSPDEIKRLKVLETTLRSQLTALSLSNDSSTAAIHATVYEICSIVDDAIMLYPPYVQQAYNKVKNELLNPVNTDYMNNAIQWAALANALLPLVIAL